MQIISLIFQTEGGWLSREGGLLQKLAFRRGGGLIGEGELNRASTVLASGRRVDLSQGHSDYKSSVLITRPVALLWTSLEISPFFSLVVWLTLLILSDSFEGYILLAAGRQGQQTIRLIFCRKRWFTRAYTIGLTAEFNCIIAEVATYATPPTVAWGCKRPGGRSYSQPANTLQR